jgi:hypothetical protein
MLGTDRFHVEISTNVKRKANIKRRTAQGQSVMSSLLPYARGSRKIPAETIPDHMRKNPSKRSKFWHRRGVPSVSRGHGHCWLFEHSFTSLHKTKSWTTL